MSTKTQEFIVRVKNVRIGEVQSDKTHEDTFTEKLHALANTKILVKRISETWYESKNYFFHRDWVEVIKKI